MGWIQLSVNTLSSYVLCPRHSVSGTWWPSGACPSTTAACRRRHLPPAAAGHSRAASCCPANTSATSPATESWRATTLETWVRFCLKVVLRAGKSPYVLHPVSQKFPQRCLIRNRSSVRLNLTTAFFRPFKGDGLALPLSTPFSRRSMVCCPWLCAHR